ncbi:mechanosensitive ion channel family protein [Pararobbsia silviterrae]|uniref:mechanosensitive ion channel family protein n=1 Tax=Pararobbsia silviterrae TaxID=1792498 RepID=UPI001F0BACFB|nr:mechanosensitive ion channel domain-containing protein [Pararobbsia silviterrae]
MTGVLVFLCLLVAMSAAFVSPCAHAADAGSAAPAPATVAPTGAAAAIPSLPAFAKLIAPAQPASAASAPSPASQAELEQSLDSVISTLDNDKQRTALVTQLKKLRDANRLADASQTAAPPASAGLLGAIATGLTEVQQNVRVGRSPYRYWQSRMHAAARDWVGIFYGSTGTPFKELVLDFFSLLALWAFTVFALAYAERRCARYFRYTVRLQPNPTTPALLLFATRRIAPLTVAFVVTLTLQRMLDPSLGRMLVVIVAYAIVAGAVFSALCLIMFSLFSAGHRRAAVQVLLVRARRLLVLVGVLGALGDAAVDDRVVAMLGGNLAALLSTFCNMGAAISVAVFALAFRRPIAHLLGNRAYEYRTAHRARNETFSIIASLWHMPVLLLCFASILATIMGTDSSEHVLQKAIGSAVLMVVAFFLTAIIRHLTRSPERARRRQRHGQSVYLIRLVRFFGSLLTVFVWLGFIELNARVWDHSVLRFARESASGRGISHSIFSICATLFFSWLVWIILDTAVTEALNPTTHRGKQSKPSSRARTMLPLIRNFTFVVILVIVIISTLANLGINVTPLIAGASVIGLAFGFGAQSLVQDLITGLFILIEDTISVGDSIEVDGGHAGIVETLSIRTCRLRDSQGAIHAIPFSQIKTIKNLSRDFAYAVFDVRVPFSADVDQITELIREVGKDLHDDVRYRREMLGPVEVFGLDRFDPNWMVIKGQIRTRPLQQWPIVRAFNQRLKRKMDEAGVEIPVPQMMLRSSTDAQAVASRDDASAPMPARDTWQPLAPRSAHGDEPAAEHPGEHDTGHGGQHGAAPTSKKPLASSDVAQASQASNDIQPQISTAGEGVGPR